MDAYDRRQVDRLKEAVEYEVVAAEELLAQWVTKWSGKTELSLYEHMTLKIKLINVLISDRGVLSVCGVERALDSLGACTDEVRGSVRDVALSVDSLSGYLAQ